MGGSWQWGVNVERLSSIVYLLCAEGRRGERQRFGLPRSVARSATKDPLCGQIGYERSALWPDRYERPLCGEIGYEGSASDTNEPEALAEFFSLAKIG